MWELIRSNRIKSRWLFFLMGLCLVTLGFLAGSAYIPGDGGLFGVIAALSFWLILSLVSYFSGSSILLAVSIAKEVTYDVHPQLFNVVEEMKIASGLNYMPKVYIINAWAPNAFATGISPDKSAIAVTSGLLAKLNRDELQGVIAHEISHIMNRDIKYITFASVMIGSIVLFSEILYRSFFYSGKGSVRYSLRSSGTGGQIKLFILIFAVVSAIISPIFARLLYFAISRRREYLADASAVRLTRYPEGLAAALEKIASSVNEIPSANRVTAPLFIVNPLKRKGRKLNDLTSTHPPISERIRILRTMAGGVNYINYQEAYSNVTGTKNKIIPDSGLVQFDMIGISKIDKAAAPKKTVKEEKRAFGDITMKVNNFAFIQCTCGLKMKVPPGFNKPYVMCPKCGKRNNIIKNNEVK